MLSLRWPQHWRNCCWSSHFSAASGPARIWHLVCLQERIPAQWVFNIVLNHRGWNDHLYSHTWYRDSHIRDTPASIYGRIRCGIVTSTNSYCKWLIWRTSNCACCQINLHAKKAQVCKQHFHWSHGNVMLSIHIPLKTPDYGDYVLS